jgi:hypothetical protein
LQRKTNDIISKDELIKIGAQQKNILNEIDSINTENKFYRDEFAQIKKIVTALQRAPNEAEFN